MTPVGLSFSGDPNPSLRLIAAPYAGGGIAVFHKWAESLPAGVQVCAVQLPGRDARMALPAFTRVMPLVDVLAKAVAPYLDRPFVLFGHSMGGLIVFELARALRERQMPPPEHFFVSGCRAPQRPRRRHTLYQLPDAEFVRELRERYQGIPQIVLSDPDLMKMFLGILRADLELVETYEDSGGPPFDFPITTFGGDYDREIVREDLEAWTHQTTKLFRLHMYPGAHFFINTERLAVLRTLHESLLQHI